MIAWWSWLLTAVGVTGLYFAGRKRALGWGIGLGAQVLWIAYALSTEQYGFLVSAGAYGWVYARNFRAWRCEQEVADGGERTDAEGSGAPAASKRRERPVRRVRGGGRPGGASAS